MAFKEDFPDFAKEILVVNSNQEKTVGQMIELIKKHCLDKQKVKEIIDKYILTDLQGNPMPECKVLWKIKKELGLM